jgi:hypothetical protein
VLNYTGAEEVHFCCRLARTDAYGPFEPFRIPTLEFNQESFSGSGRRNSANALAYVRFDLRQLRPLAQSAPIRPMMIYDLIGLTS